MKIKKKDIDLLMQYLAKEGPELIDIDWIEGFKTGINFNFADAEGRDCTVTLYESLINTTPLLTKKMNLYSRIKGSKPSSGQSQDGDT
jgi:hypothetical protein